MLDDCQGNLDSWYRHISKGAWPFSTADHGWPISDCTAEGLKVRYTIFLVLISSCFTFHPICVLLIQHRGNFCLLIQAALLLSKLPAETVGEPLDAKRLFDAVNVIFSLQVLLICC